MPSIASALPFHSSLPLEVNNRKPGESDLRKTLSTRRTNRVYRQATQIAGEYIFTFLIQREPKRDIRLWTSCGMNDIDAPAETYSTLGSQLMWFHFHAMWF